MTLVAIGGVAVGVVGWIGPAGCGNAWAQRPQGGPGMPGTVVATHRLQVGGTTLQVDFAAGAFDLSSEAVLGHVDMAVKAVAAYYGKFPVAGARVLIVPVAGDRGILQGTTWGA